MLKTSCPSIPQNSGRFSSYERDANGGDEAMHRRTRLTGIASPNPTLTTGSYNLADPQSFNRYAYVQNDPVNFVDPSVPTSPGPRVTPSLHHRGLARLFPRQTR